MVERRMECRISEDLRLLHDLIDSAAAHYPEKTALRAEDGECTYAQLKSMSGSMARHLHDLGVRRGDRVVILVENSIPVAVTAVAAVRIGAIFAVLDPAIKDFSLQPVLDDCSPAAVVTTSSRAERHLLRTRFQLVLVDDDYEEALVKEAWSTPSPGISIDPAGLFFTSGTASHVKAIISPHDRMLFAVRAIQDRLKYRASDVIGSFLPMSFDYGFYQFLLAAAAGATLALGRPTDASVAIVKMLHEWGATVFPMTPSLAYVVIRVASRPEAKLPQLRMATNTGSHLPASYISRLKDLFPGLLVYVMFGLTECKRVSILDPDQIFERPGSVGQPLSDTECLIIGQDENTLPPGEVGELVVRGPHVRPGYWNAPEQTAQRFRPWGPGAEIALYTGDLASLDQDGYLYFHGRLDDVFKQHGYRVSATEIEHAALDIPEVADAAVLPPDADRGSVLFVCGSITSDEVVGGLHERLEDYRLPEVVVTMVALPRTPRGKVDKRALGGGLDPTLGGAM
jgi:acyl-CoA synthetase (AMP-forming)/AMP-acid ligase II